MRGPLPSGGAWACACLTVCPTADETGVVPYGVSSRASHPSYAGFESFLDTAIDAKPYI